MLRLHEQRQTHSRTAKPVRRPRQDRLEHPRRHHFFAKRRERTMRVLHPAEPALIYRDHDRDKRSTARGAPGSAQSHACRCTRERRTLEEQQRHKVQRAVDRQRPARDCEHPVRGDGEAPCVTRVRDGAGTIGGKCLLPFGDVCSIVWVEIWPRKDTRDVGGVVGPVPYHTEMRGQNFLWSLCHVFEPMRVLWALERTDSRLHDAPHPVTLWERVRTQEKCICDLPTPVLTSERGAILKNRLVRQCKDQNVTMWNMETTFFRVSIV
jgi:hypothetical protein